MKIKLHLIGYYIIYVMSILAVYLSQTQYTGLAMMGFGVAWFGRVYTEHLEDKNTDITLQTHWKHYVGGISLLIFGGIADAIPFLGMLTSFAFVYWLFFWTKRNKKDVETERGTRIVDLTKKVIKPEKDIIHFGAAEYPREIEGYHLMIAGAPGSGKSVAFGDILDVARHRKERAVVYDTSGELIERYYRKDKDVILNPFDERHAFWTPFHDAKTSLEIRSFASSIIPFNVHQDPFWTNAPRSFISTALSTTDNMRSFNYLLFNSDEKMLLAALKAAGKLAAAGSDKTFLNIRSQLSSIADALTFLHDEPDKPKFSLKDWIKKEDDSWLFISSKESYLDLLTPLISCWLDILVKANLDLKPDRNRKIWYLIDEFSSLQQMESVQAAMARGRKYGVAMVLSIQDINQIEEKYGAAGAKSIISQSSSKLFLRLNDPSTAEWASKIIGERDIKRKTERESSGKNPSTSVSDSFDKQNTVLPSEILNLKDMTAFFRVPGDIVYKIKYTFKERKTFEKGFIHRELKPMTYNIDDEANKTEETDVDKDKKSEKPKKQINSSIPDF